MRFQWLIVTSCVLVSLAVTGASRDSAAAASAGRLQVVASIFPLADWVRQVGGDRVAVVTLLPGGSSPHTFDPSPREVRSVANSQLFVKVGLRLDDWTNKIARAAGGDLTILSLGDILARQGKLPDVEVQHEAHAEKSQHDKHLHDYEGVNPHFWLDPVLAKLAVTEIASQLSRIDPASSGTYAVNAARYAAELDALDAEIRSMLAGCAHRDFVSFHNAFCYMAKRYDLRVAAVIEEYPGKTPSDRYVMGVIDQLRSLGVKTVFAEPQLSPRVAEIIAREAKATVDILDPNGGEAISNCDSYLKLMRFNAEKLRKALCSSRQ